MTVAKRIVVVGGGVAGTRAVEALRAGGFEGDLTMVDAGADLPYDRPPLSKEFLTGVFDEDEIRLWSAERVAELGVGLRLGTRAVRLDAGRRRLSVRSAADGADEVEYDRLVLATGVVARRPAAFPALDGVHVLGSLPDARALRSRLRATPGPVVVVGGGFIGGEVAAAAATLGLDVTIVEAGGNLLSTVLTADLAAPLEHLHASTGVRVLRGRAVAGLHGAGRVEGVDLADGTRLPAAVVVLGLGGAPDTGWLHGSAVTLGDGIETDDCLRTTADEVYAIGDAARWRDSATGRHVRHQHWTSAGRQGGHLARTLLGTAAPYRDVPYVWSDQHGVQLQIAGAADGDEVRFVDGGPGADGYVAVVRRGAHLAGVIALDRRRAFLKLRRTLAGSPLWDSVVATANPHPQGATV